MVFGFDFSHHNKDIDIASIAADFVFLKASEGKTYRDPEMQNFIKKLKMKKVMLGEMPFIGFYHYARPDINISPSEEAANFLNTIKPHIGNCMLALDWEGYAIKVKGGEDWALHWLDMVGNATGSTPIFYVQASAFNKYPRITKEFPTWVACYSQSSRAGKYKEECDKADFLQITSNPFDIDFFKYSSVELARIIKGDFRKE